MRRSYCGEGQGRHRTYGVWCEDEPALLFVDEISVLERGQKERERIGDIAHLFPGYLRRPVWIVERFAHDFALTVVFVDDAPEPGQAER